MAESHRDTFLKMNVEVPVCDTSLEQRAEGISRALCLGVGVTLKGGNTHCSYSDFIYSSYSGIDHEGTSTILILSQALPV